MSDLKILMRYAKSFWILPLVKVFNKTADINNNDSSRQVTAYTLRNYLNGLEIDTVLGFDSDELFLRASSVGVDLQKVEPSCERAIIVKFLDKCIRSLNEETNTSAVFEKLNTFFEPLEAHFEKKVSVRPDYSKFTKKELVYCQAVYHFFIIILQDIYGDFVISETKLKKYQKFVKEVVSRLVADSDSSILHSLLDNADYEKIASNNPYRHQLLHQLEKSTFDTFNYFDVFLSPSVDKATFSKILNEHAPPTLTPFEQLDEALLWKEFHVLEARKDLFLGRPTFEAVLRGELQKEREPDYKLKVRRFRHVDHDNKFCSYAILVEMYGSFGSDWSGWLIFKEIGGDYAGLGGQLYYETEQLIREFKDAIECKTLDVPMSTFLPYLKRKNPYLLEFPEEDEEDGAESIPSDYSPEFLVAELDARNKKIGKLVRDSLSQLIELLAYRYFILKYESVKVIPNLPLARDNKEIDVVVVNESTKETFLVECSLSLESPTKLIPEINNKEQFLSTRYPNQTKIRKILITTAKSFKSKNIDKIQSEFDSKHIEIKKIEDLISDMNLPSNKLSQYKQIFDWYSNQDKLVA